MSVQLYLPNIRISYPTLFTPRAVRPGDTPKFGAQLMIPVDAPADPRNQVPGNTLIEQIWGARHQIWQAEFGGVEITNPQKELPFKDGNTLAQKHPEYVGYWILSANSRNKPHTVDENVQPIIDESKIYAGCFVNASVGLFSYENMGKGIACGLNGVQYASEGERLDGRPAAADLFQAVPGAPAPVSTPPAYAPTQQAPQPPAGLAPHAPQPQGTPAVPVPPVPGGQNWQP